MRRLLGLICILYLLSVTKPVWEESVLNLLDPSIVESLIVKIESMKDDPDVTFALNKLFNNVNEYITQLDDAIEPHEEEESSQIDKEIIDVPTLAPPSGHPFSIYNIELGDHKNEVELSLGVSNRSTTNEYGVSWHTYHEDYHNFIMIAYDENQQVRGMYTNQDLISSSLGIKLGSKKEIVQEKLGKPLTKIRKGLIYYQVQSNGEYDVYQIENNYVTIFYDKHSDEVVTAMQVIDHNLEENKGNIYSEPSENLKRGFEFQLFDLTNATRVKHGLPILKWSEDVQTTARGHSLDMAENQYFDHTNLLGESPFDRMEEDAIHFSLAGENLAYGQFSSIFAHEGLMNSMGHRKNILHPDYEYLGIGVAFNSQSQPYYTENFYTD
jgi:uncharacterized protein YkwD